MNAPTCSSTRRDGSPCRATPTASGRCFAHDADLQESTANGRRKGGANRSNARRAARRLPVNMKDLQEQLMTCITEVHDGELDHRRAAAMASLASAIVRIHEVAETEARLEALEAAQSQKGWGA